jgi:hypothetical protein
MDGGDHPRGGKPSVSQLLQGLQKRLEILLSVAQGPIAPVAACGGHHSLRKRREPPIVVPKVKPPALPPLVRRHKDGGDVLLRKRLPQLEDAAASPHRHANSPFPCRQGKRLHGEEMGPQIPVGVNPQKPFANHREDGCLHDGVGAEIVQLHPVEMLNRPHEATCWHSEPPLMERDETQHIPRRRGRGGSARRAIHSGCGSPERGRSKPLATRASRSSAVTVEKGHGSRGGTTVTRSAITKRRRWRRSRQGARFSFSGYSLRLRKPKREASSRVKNHHRSLFQIYKGPGETRSTLRPNLPRNPKLDGETTLPRTARTTAAPRNTRPVALTLRQGRQHLLAGEAGDASPPP